MKMKFFWLLLLAAMTIAATSCEEPEELELEKTYTVTFNSNDGSAVDPQTVKEGEKATRPSPDPTKDGFYFVGWFSDVALNNVYDFDTPVTKNITLYAKWTTVQYAVAFESNGGSKVDTQYVAQGALVTRPNPNPTKSGFVLESWCSDSTLTTVYSFSTPVAASFTLFAKWKPTYTVRFNSNGGSTVATQIVAHGDTATRPSNPAKLDVVFDNWYTDSLTLNNVYDFSTPVTENIVLFAKWIVITVDDLQALIEEAEGINLMNYTGWDNSFAEKLQAARDIVDNPNSYTQGQINTAYAELRAAIDALEPLPHRAVAAISTDPYGFNDTILVNIGGSFYLHAVAVDENGYIANDSRVRFTQSLDLNGWVASGEQLYESDNHIHFLVNPTLTSGTTTAIIISSVDNPDISRTITLKAVGEGEMRDAFLAAVAALPAFENITADDEYAIWFARDLYNQLSGQDIDSEVEAAFARLELCLQHVYKAAFLAAVAVLPEPGDITRADYDALWTAENLYSHMDETFRANDAGVIVAYGKLAACWAAYEALPKEHDMSLSYSFSGNNSVMLGGAIPFTYTPNGAFPFGTYLMTEWMYGELEEGEYAYGQYRIVLKSDFTFEWSLRTADDETGTNPSGWETFYGTYTYSGDQATGGEFFFFVEDLGQGEDKPEAGTGSKPLQKAVKAAAKIAWVGKK